MELLWDLAVFIFVTLSFFSQGNGIFTKNFPHWYLGWLVPFVDHVSLLVSELGKWTVLTCRHACSRVCEWSRTGTTSLWHSSLWHLLGFTHLIILLFSSLQISFHWFHLRLASWFSGTKINTAKSHNSSIKKCIYLYTRKHQDNLTCPK